ncbi:MAG: hypothetical protein H6Q25_870 [Bacteroidetes bacterium]|nr:hypothetical protein [Bacteroidota bacterium]
MKKSILLTMALVLFAFIVKADPPKKINLSVKNNKLTVEIVHPVKNPGDHYIDQVVITINGKEFKTLKYTKQSSEKGETVVIDIPSAKAGDVVEVKARCNEFGNKSNKIKI